MGQIDTVCLLIRCMEEDTTYVAQLNIKPELHHEETPDKPKWREIL